MMPRRFAPPESSREDEPGAKMPAFFNTRWQRPLGTLESSWPVPGE